MENLDELQNKHDDLIKQRIELEKKLYKKKYPNENFPMPEIVASLNFYKDAISTYKDFNYPDDYIKNLNKKNWKSTVALTINNFNLAYTPKIIINEFLWREDTILHELTHVSDYYDYCKRHNYLNLTFLELLDLEDFICIYLFSEFRAFYRGALYSSEDLKVQLEYETKEFNNNQVKAIDMQDLEAYYYHSIRYIGFYCAYIEKNASKYEIDYILQRNDSNIIHTLIKFFYPLREKDFCELETYITEFKSILDNMVDPS